MELAALQESPKHLNNPHCHLGIDFWFYKAHLNASFRGNWENWGPLLFNFNERSYGLEWCDSSNITVHPPSRSVQGQQTDQPRGRRWCDSFLISNLIILPLIGSSAATRGGKRLGLNESLVQVSVWQNVWTLMIWHHLLPGGDFCLLMVPGRAFAGILT